MYTSRLVATNSVSIFRTTKLIFYSVILIVLFNIL
uniref:Uncharacterized protein n=1 Tax=Siphoviridae sp. ctHiz26 TaxID=2825423 RepID=A0A8S5Q571_9CAUD|nr:MAG TPA: hypothetical protein [Siphoviridae sp. ctHiz26]